MAPGVHSEHALFAISLAGHAMVPGGATEQTAISTRDVAPGGRHEPRVQLITCGAGAKWAGLSDRRDRFLKMVGSNRVRDGLCVMV